MITYPHVTIAGQEYEALTDLATADDYLAADPTAEAWRALADDTDQQGRFIVLASRTLNGLAWPGRMTDPDQPYAWPRTNVSTVDGPVDPDVIPVPIANATAQLASLAAGGLDIANMRSTAQTEKRIKAGSVEVEHFRGAEGEPYPLPWSVWSILLPYLGAGGSGTLGARSSGTCGESITERPFDYTGGGL